MRKPLALPEIAPRLANLISLLLFVLIAAVDYATPREISTSVFYLLPVVVSAWFGGRYSGLAMALLASLAWMGKDIVWRPQPYSEQWILFWNTTVRLIFFSTIAYLIAEVRMHLRWEQQQGVSDSLTGLLNSRGFRSRLELELKRARRHGQPLSLAYVDLDSFKAVNDTLGHGEGDRVLETVGKVLRERIRETDAAGRLGGDEFAILLPATGAEDSRQALHKVMAALRASASRWPIGFSVGAVTCVRCEASAEQLLAAADRLMYDVKRAQKNDLSHRIFEPAPTGASQPDD